MSHAHFEIGQKVGSFVIERVEPLEELKSVLVEAKHVGCGASVMYIGCDDPENLFCISLKTYPDQSDGVAHILEHTVLCGSKNYPVRDPFFSMNRRSLNTFMNAMTGSDFTCYPAASLVEADFYNLLEVYLDAVFHPLLTQESFWQEGHRLELTEKGHLTRKGIVFNEMKGALASADSRLGEVLMQALMPNLTYGVNSGGDPKEIPSLTYEKLKQFHQAYYHPSRALFFFYGNLPLEKHLSFLDKKVLQGVEPVDKIPSIPKQKRFSKPVKKIEPYPISLHESDEERTLVALSWLTCSILEQEELLALIVIELVLMGTDAAPLKMALLKSGLCKSAESVVDAEMSEIPFTIALKGCEKGSSERVERFIFNELKYIAEKGLDPNLVDGAIHQLELARSEVGGGGHPFGLALFMRAALLKQHGGKPESALLIHTLFNSLRKEVKKNRYLPGLIEKYLLQNPHRVTIEMQPDKGLGKQEEDEEKRALEQIEKELSEREKKELVEQSKRLAGYQEEGLHQNLDVLPKIGLSDVPKEPNHFPLHKEKMDALEVYHHDCFTNGVIYADVVFDLPKLTDEERKLLRLFAIFAPQLGCGGRTYKENLDYILEHTGGIDMALDLGIQVHSPDRLKPTLSIRGKALARKGEWFFSLFKQMILSIDFTDEKRIEELLMQHLHALEESVHRGGLRYAINLGLSGCSKSALLSNEWFGLPYYWHIKKVAQTFKEKPSTLITAFQNLQNKVLALKGGRLLLSCEKNLFETLKQQKFYGLSELPQKEFAPWHTEVEIKTIPSQGRLTSAPVAFTAYCFPSIPYPDPRSAALAVASEIMQNTVLHPKIREQGGAYGAGAVQGLMSGQFYFYAFRDPHLGASVAAMQEAIRELSQGKFNETDLEEGKLGIIQQLDDPVSVGSRAETAFFREHTGKTLPFRQAFRDTLIHLTKGDVQQGVKEVLLPQIESGTLIAFAGNEFFEKENPALPAPLPLYPIEP